MMALLQLLAFLPALSHGFIQPQITSASQPHQQQQQQQQQQQHGDPCMENGYSNPFSMQRPRHCATCCFMTQNNQNTDDDDDNYDDDDDIDPNSLGDWRTFRMNLANSNLSSSTTSASTVTIQEVDGINLVDDNNTGGAAANANTNSATEEADSRRVKTTSSSDSAALSSSSVSSSRPKSVSKQNEKLLRGQNEALAEEYLKGVWAHESAIPEVGGLVCRMPLEAEIFRGNENSSLYKKLQQFLDSDEYDRAEDSMVKKSTIKLPITKSLTTDKGNEEDEDEEDASFSFSALAAKTAFWYRGAEKLLKRELERIVTTANSNGKIDANDLDGESLELLQLYMDQQETWQGVCLVIEKDEKRGSAKTVTINRPMAFKLSKSMGRLVLFGAYSIQDRKETQNVGETQNMVKFLSAFENECGVYIGGSDKMDEPATLIHGIAGLPGSEEISPGTGIYMGGLEAAMDGVISGKYKPLDFRFFIGHSSYEGGELDKAVKLGKWQPVACSRPLVLKQCIQLPKPLWHEVLEFCGGELKEISKLEFMKREDLQ